MKEVNLRYELMFTLYQENKARRLTPLLVFVMREKCLRMKSLLILSRIKDISRKHVFRRLILGYVTHFGDR